MSILQAPDAASSPVTSLNAEANGEEEWNFQFGKRKVEETFPGQPRDKILLPQTTRAMFFFEAKSHLTVYLVVKGAAQETWVVPGVSG